jgi:hypothetical protein
VGQVYARVATDEWAPDVLEPTIEETLNRAAFWAPKSKVNKLRKAIDEWRAQHVGASPYNEDIAKLIGEIPSRQESVVVRILELLQNNLGIRDATKSPKFGNTLRGDGTLERLLKD